MRMEQIAEGLKMPYELEATHSEQRPTGNGPVPGYAEMQIFKRRE
jgi:hypothetical protein